MKRKPRFKFLLPVNIEAPTVRGLALSPIFYFLRDIVFEVKIIRGLPASSGKIKGIVQVAFLPSEVKEGVILVTTMTTPEWTPVFGKIRAVVTDESGVLSHAAIVAREYGIPAVVGTGDATGRLKTGDCVEVDGDEGIVRILDSCE